MRSAQAAPALAARIQVVGAGAGSGKTTYITQLIAERLAAGALQPEGVIATTFTVKAAQELKTRIRSHLFASGLTEAALQLDAANVGTVHSVCERLLLRFPFELGLSPDLDVLDEVEERLLFNEALTAAIDEDLRNRIEQSLVRFEGDRRWEKPDWREDLRKLVRAARENGLGMEGLAHSAAQSWKTYADFLPEPGKAEDFDDRQLLGLLERTLTDLDALVAARAAEGKEPQKNTDRFRQILLELRDRLRGGRELTWAERARLSKAFPSGKSHDKAHTVTGELQAVAGRFLEHPKLHADIKLLIEGLFGMTRHALDAYQAHKSARGFIDFTDMEALTLRLLDVPAVHERLTEELELLVVDEFQDTSPMQLAIFLRLAEFATEVVFVGDPKQAIYAFRGTDPALMEAVVKTTQNFGSRRTLDKSYRSRPDLVHFASELFANAYSSIHPREQVALEPQRSDPLDEPAVIRWQVPPVPADGSAGRRENSAWRNRVLATGVHNLIAAGKRISDPQTGVVRAISGGDIAVLCRTNQECRAVADELKALGIDTARAQPGLGNTPEVRLLLAGLRRLTDSGDVLAAADILLLTDPNPNAVALLQSRLDWLEGEQPPSEWARDHAVVKKIDELAGGTRLAPAMAVDEMIDLLELRWLAHAWGRAEARSSNLERVRALAREYEERATKLAAGATVPGFLRWFDALTEAEEDTQGEGAGPDAVHVLTYHKAKGLEWPVVVAHSLHSYSQVYAFGVRVIGRDEVKLDEPLAGRHVRYWPWPFGGLSDIPGLRDELKDIYAQANEQAIAEDLRLMYVGLTRARDFLVVLTGTKPALFDIPFNRKPKISPRLPTGDGVTHWSSGTVSLPVEVRAFAGSEPKQAKRTQSTYITPPPGPREWPAAVVRPSALEAVASAKVGETNSYGKRIALPSGVDVELLGNALHAFLAWDLPKESAAPVRLARCTDLLAAFGTAVGPDAVLQQANLFRAALEVFKPKRLLAEWPVFQVEQGGTLLRGAVDLLLESEKAWTLIDHKSFPGRDSELAAKALSYSGQLRAYAAAVKAATGRPVESLWIHFFVLGKLVEVKL